MSMVIAMYAGIKFIALYTKHNPVTSSYYKQNEAADELTIDLKERNFRIAFTVEDYAATETKDDPRYVKWIFRLYGKR